MAFEDKTLDEIREHHEDNMASIIRNDITVKAFPSVVYAVEYRTAVMNKCFEKLGFNVAFAMSMCTSAETAAEVIDDLLAKHNVRVEDWSQADHIDEKWRGIYMYKDNEIAYFVSDVQKVGDNVVVATNMKW